MGRRISVERGQPYTSGKNSGPLYVADKAALMSMLRDDPPPYFRDQKDHWLELWDNLLNGRPQRDGRVWSHDEFGAAVKEAKDVQEQEERELEKRVQEERVRQMPILEVRLVEA
jgi:hypothetical protein